LLIGGTVPGSVTDIYGPYPQEYRRLNPDGTIDKTFGHNGVITFEDVSAAIYNAGKLFIITNGDLNAIHAYTPNGKPDETFGRDGVEDVPFKPATKGDDYFAETQFAAPTSDGGLLLRLTGDTFSGGDIGSNFNE